MMPPMMIPKQKPVKPPPEMRPSSSALKPYSLPQLSRMPPRMAKPTPAARMARKPAHSRRKALGAAISSPAGPSGGLLPHEPGFWSLTCPGPLMWSLIGDCPRANRVTGREVGDSRISPAARSQMPLPEFAAEGRFASPGRLAADQRLAQLARRAGLHLADALLRQPQLPADLLQRVAAGPVVQPEAPLQHLPLARRE